MLIDKKKILKSYISNLQVDLIYGDFTKCGVEWQDFDFIPDYNKFYYIIDGEGMLKIGDKVYYPKPGEFYILPQGVKQSYSTINTNTFIKYWCHFTATIGEKNLFDIVQLPYCINIGESQFLKDLFIEMFKYESLGGIASEIKKKAQLLNIIAFYLENTYIDNIKLSSSESVEKLNSIISYIDNHICEDISVSHLAEMLHFHPNYFSRFFKSNFGVSPQNYINKKKIEAAKSIINSTDKNISEISEYLGFNDISYFSRMFKNYTSYSPSEFKKIVSLK